MKKKQQYMTAVILVGGFGTRIRHVLGDTPKPLAQVNGKPFLHWVLKSLRWQNIREVYLLTHYSSDLIEKFALSESDEKFKIKCIREVLPSGTGGSVLNFLKLGFTISSPFLLLNGDSLLLGSDISAAKEKMAREHADGVLFGVELLDASRYGTMKYNNNSELIMFEEKKNGEGIINAGVYLLNPDVFKSVNESSWPISIENEIIPKLILDGKKILVVKENGPFIDIGTEKSLSEANDFVNKNFMTEEKL